MATFDKQKSKSIARKIPIKNDGEKREIFVHWVHHVLTLKKSGILKSQWVEIILTIVRPRKPEEVKSGSDLIKVGSVKHLSIAPDWKIKQDVTNWLGDEKFSLIYVDPVMDKIKDLKK